MTSARNRDRSSVCRSILIKSISHSTHHQLKKLSVIWRRTTVNGLGERSKYVFSMKLLFNPWFKCLFLQTLRTVSPTSLKVALRQLNLGSKFSLGECFQMEYRLTMNFFGGNDFREGINWRITSYYLLESCILFSFQALELGLLSRIKIQNGFHLELRTSANKEFSLSSNHYPTMMI